LYFVQWVFSRFAKPPADFRGTEYARLRLFIARRFIGGYTKDAALSSSQFRACRFASLGNDDVGNFTTNIGFSLRLIQWQKNQQDINQTPGFSWPMKGRDT